jgi:hypothetical protein
MLKTLLLDGNIYNELSADAETRTVLTNAIADRLIRVIATPVVVELKGPAATLSERKVGSIKAGTMRYFLIRQSSPKSH